jgi:ABC-2 type transport system ATP-binding protein
LSIDQIELIVFEDVSKFYGEILGVNRVNLTIAPGITSLVGPNGSGKTTLDESDDRADPADPRTDQRFSGLRRPSRSGSFGWLGTAASSTRSRGDDWSTSLSSSFLRVHGYKRDKAEEKAWQAIERVGLVEAAEPQGCRLQQGDASADPPRPVDRARAAGHDSR